MGRKTQRCPECKGSKVLTSTTLRIEANEQARREGRRLPPTPFSGRPSWRKYYPACPICDGRGRIPLRIYTIRVQRLEHTNYPPYGEIDELPGCFASGEDIAEVFEELGKAIKKAEGEGLDAARQT